MIDITPERTITLRMLDRDDLPVAGGKGANLGSMLQAGLPVPPGFCVTADAYREAVADASATITARLARLDVDDHHALETAAEAIRAAIEGLRMPDGIAASVRESYRQIGAELGSAAPPVAVRSSATAEDLPDASFAGQQ